jgi:hypothetical protein
MWSVVTLRKNHIDWTSQRIRIYRESCQAAKWTEDQVFESAKRCARNGKQRTSRHLLHWTCDYRCSNQMYGHGIHPVTARSVKLSIKHRLEVRRLDGFAVESWMRRRFRSLSYRVLHQSLASRNLPLRTNHHRHVFQYYEMSSPLISIHRSSLFIHSR